MSAEFDQKIAFGGDSSVYRMGADGPVKKVYDGGPLCAPVPIDKVFQYAQITNKAARFVNGSNLNIGDKHYQVNVNPIDKVYELDGVGVVESAFVEGDSLAGSAEVGVTRAELFRLSKKLENDIGVSGIEIIPGNTKISGGKLVVTDLCASVRKLCVVTPSGIEH